MQNNNGELLIVNCKWKNVVNTMCRRDAKFCVSCEMKHFIYKTMSKKS